MILAARKVAAQLVATLQASDGVVQSLAAQGVPPEEAQWVTAQDAIETRQASPDLSEKQARVRYPPLSVYCEKIENRLTEKFRRFSGIVRMVIEVRVGGSHLDSLLDHLQDQTDAVLDTLERKRGDWGNGLFWSGAYEVTFSAAKHGGPNYLQTAKIVCDFTLGRD